MTWHAIDTQSDLDALDKRVWREDSETVEYYGTFRDENYFPSDVSHSGYNHKNIHVLCRSCSPALYVEMVWIQCDRFTSYFLDHPYMSGRVDSLKRVEILDGDGSTQMRCARVIYRFVDEDDVIAGSYYMRSQTENFV